MYESAEPDLISDLPASIVEIILSFVPLRDAVKTSILSTKWRYRWTTLTQLVFDNSCVPLSTEGDAVQDVLLSFITRALFLHHGPVHKFQLSASCLQSCPDIDQWILFLSRRELRELILDLGEGEWFRVPSCLFQCQKLVRLELLRCELHPPPCFKGFSCLRVLSLHHVLIDASVIGSIISSCPLLESLELSYFDDLPLVVSAPNLTYLYLEGEFRDIYLENTPLLVTLYISMYMSDDVVEAIDQSSGCNFMKLLGGLSHLEKLVGQIYFTKFLSVGICIERKQITYNKLKHIELHQVNFEDFEEVLVVLRLIVSCPALQELYISGAPVSALSTTPASTYSWSKEELRKGCTFNHLHLFKLSDAAGLPYEMGFIKFLLESSPVLESITILSSVFLSDGGVSMLSELVRFRRASSKAEVLFRNY